jgi:predicted transcriptional regulator
LANKTFAAVRVHLEHKRNNIDITKLQREWEELKRERETESKTMHKLVEGLKRAVKGFGENNRLDKLLEYLSEQMRLLKEANRNQA